MALNASTLSNLIKNGLLSGGIATETGGQLQNTCDSIAESIVDHFKDDQVVQIPIGAVIVSVTGGSGAPAVGVPNAAPIDCVVS